jgi:uncharacterized Tic20 family protein
MDTNELIVRDVLTEDPVTQDERNIALLSHVLAFFTSFIGPLVIYLVKKDESKFITDHAKESLNFQITLIIGYIIGGILSLILIGIVVLLALGVLNIVFIVVASIKAAEGKPYLFPFNIRFIK